MSPTVQVSSNTIKSPGTTRKPVTNPEDDQELGDGAKAGIAIGAVTVAVGLAISACFIMNRTKPSLPGMESQEHLRVAEAAEDGAVVSTNTDDDTHEIEDHGIVSEPVVDTPAQPIAIPDPDAPQPRRWLPDDDLAGKFLPYNAGGTP